MLDWLELDQSDFFEKGRLVLSRLVYVVLFICVGFNTSAFAETYALLIGVSGYPSLPEARRLQGPSNDVGALRAALLRKGMTPSHITTLADGVLGSAALPTKLNILSHLAMQAQRAQLGDWVIVYFSGHGSQQPQRPVGQRWPDTYVEPDGLDEIFLPYDIGQWDGKKGQVQGALVDDEIGVTLARIIQKGAQVWAIFDTCHAGDMAKGRPTDPDAPALRYINPITLGIPIDALDAAGQTSKQFKSSTKKRALPPSKVGQLVTFYASHPDEPASEEPLPPLTADGVTNSATAVKRYFGLFTYLIAQALPTWNGSLRQLSDHVAAKYKIRPYPTPLFEGNLDQTPTFSKSALTKP